MNSSDAQSPESPENTPLGQFAQCHVGILSHLDDLAKLPGLLEPAAQARQIAAATLTFFRAAVFEHHQEEEKELFPAVLSSAAEGAEHDRVLSITNRLTREHRDIETDWKHLEPALKKIAKGAEVALDTQNISELIRLYRAHAAYEEKEFLPLSQEILSRKNNDLAALGMSLHMRHAMPEVLRRYSSGI